MVVLVCRGVGRRRVYGQKRGASITLWKNPAFSEFTFAVDKDAAINSLGGGTAVVDGGKFADLAVSSWLHGRGIGKRGEERVRIQLHCEKWQNPDRNKYSPQKGDRMRRRKSLAAMALCAVVITMVCCGSLKSAGVSGGDV
jgi:hypothetical protein